MPIDWVKLSLPENPIKTINDHNCIEDIILQVRGCSREPQLMSLIEFELNNKGDRWCYIGVYILHERPLYLTTCSGLLMSIKNECPEKYSWWINELNSLGVKTDSNKNDLKDVQQLENLADDIKQTLIHDYKISYRNEK
jgi:hypothetical protein